MLVVFIDYLILVFVNTKLLVLLLEDSPKSWQCEAQSRTPVKGNKEVALLENLVNWVHREMASRYHIEALELQTHK